MAREFSASPKLLVLDQPTRGLDVGSIEFIHRRAIEMRDAGAAILLVSAELDEVLELSDRIARHVSRRAGGDARRGAARTRRRSACSWPPGGREAPDREGRGIVTAATTAQRSRSGGVGGSGRSSPSPRCRWHPSSWPSSSARISSSSPRASSRPARSTGRCRSSPTAPCSRARSGPRRPILNTILQATPLVLGGLAVGIGFKAGLFNIGGQGQFLLGGDGRGRGRRGLGDGAGADRDHGSRSWPARRPGRSGAGSPGALKALSGAHEVVTTIMLNSIAAAVIGFLILGPLLAPGFSFGRTGDLGNSVLPIILGSNIHLGVLLAVAAVPVVWWLLYRSTLGFEIRSVGANPSAARYAGMRPGVPDHAHDDPVGPPVRASPDRSRSSASATS